MIEDLAQRLGLTWFDHQLEAFDGWLKQSEPRALLHFKTGAGKSATALAMARLAQVSEAVVIAPPSTHPAWAAQAAALDIDVELISHAKYRMPDYKLSRNKAVIADEFHQFGGHKGAGWMKLDSMARHMTAPLILASATPNYNDAERVYCIKHILEPHQTKGGYIAFLHQHCNTMPNMFGREPLVNEEQPFIHYKDAADFLSALPGVYYLPDDLVYQIQDTWLDLPLPAELETHGYNRRKHRMVASRMEDKHTRVFQKLVTTGGFITQEVMDLLDHLLGNARTPVLVFAAHATVATALFETLDEMEFDVGLVTGDDSTTRKAQVLDEFRAGRLQILVGTASLATGTDGLDKMCDHLIILDDTDDDALRRQLIGRIMPRGADSDATRKQVHRILIDD